MFGLGKLFGSILGSAQAKVEKQAVERTAQDFKDLYKQPPTFDIPVTLSYEHGFTYNDEHQKLADAIYKYHIYGTSQILHPSPKVTTTEVYTESQKEIGKAFKIKKYLEPQPMIGIDWGNIADTNHITIATVGTDISQIDAQLRDHLKEQHEYWMKHYQATYLGMFPEDTDKK